MVTSNQFTGFVTVMLKSEKLFNTGKSFYNQGILEESDMHFEEPLALDPESVQSHSNLLLELNYHSDCTPDRFFRMNREFDKRHCLPLAEYIKPHSNTLDPNRRLRIGYVSPDLCGHSVAFFIVPVLAYHNAEQVEVFVYYNHHQVNVASQNMQQICHHWRNIADMTDKQVVDLIKKDGIDILVDLAGHSAFNRLPLPVTELLRGNATNQTVVYKSLII